MEQGADYISVLTRSYTVKPSSSYKSMPQYISPARLQSGVEHRRQGRLVL